ncbi:hypothetical protein DFS34DRAFT_28507 [Phlyctochytrium arcticum]|nr:hypothetical protein DFS34DRAFT_28507 [Phlyctochytrium arcticum]
MKFTSVACLALALAVPALAAPLQATPVEKNVINDATMSPQDLVAGNQLLAEMIADDGPTPEQMLMQYQYEKLIAENAGTSNLMAAADKKVTIADAIVAQKGSEFSTTVNGYVTIPNTVGNTFISMLKLLGGSNKAILEERLKLFSQVGVPGEKVSITFPESVKIDGKSQKFESSASRIGGKFTNDLKMSVDEAKEADRIVELKADVPQFGGRGFLIKQEGVSIVSDIDDTIKVSETNDKTKLLKHTFLLPFTAVDGMSKLYNGIKEQLTADKADPVFHYLSRSPWNLFEPLQKFATDALFPAGQFILRDLAVLDGSFLKFLLGDDNFKLDRIKEIQAAAPKRKFLFFGDSTEQDPEQYGAFAREFPDNVACIAIRIVTGVNAKAEAPEIEPARFQRAFAGVDPSKFMTFTDATKLDPKQLAKGVCKSA